MKTFLTFILVLWSIHLVKADMGSSALYKCSVNTESSGLLTGYFQVTTMGNLPATGKDLLSFLISNQCYTGDCFLKLYSQIVPLEYPSFGPKGFRLSAAPMEETKLINADHIQSLTILEIQASECIKAEGGDTFEYSRTNFLIGYQHPIIELTRAEIRMLNSHAPLREDSQSWDIDAILVLSYNPDLDEQSFRELSQKVIFVRNESLPHSDEGKAREAHFNKVRASLRKQKVILIRVMSYT